MTSAFHIKGNAYRGLQEFVAGVVPGGIEAVLASLTPDTRTFFRQAFGAGGWYDILPVDEITRTAAFLAKMPHEELCKRVGQSVLDRDANGLYRGLLRLASADMVVRALPYTTRRYFDFVTLEVVNLEKRSYRVNVSGIPALIASTYVYITTVFISRAIEGAGAKNLVVRTSAPQPAGSKHGVPLCTFERSLRWDL